MGRASPARVSDGASSAQAVAPAAGSNVTSKQRAPLKLSEKLWVTGTLSLITFLGASAQWLLIDYYRRSRWRALLDLSKLCWQLLLPFNVGLLSIYVNYYLCVTSSPGRVPKGWAPPPLPEDLAGGASDRGDAAADGDENDDTPLQLLKDQRAKGAALAHPLSNYRPRYCRHCKAYKPPRTHHCKTCRTCTLRMDHHCPWLANCVGHGNYPHFLRFLYSVCATCAAHLALVSLVVFDYWGQTTSGYFQPPPTRVTVLAVVNYVLCALTLLLVGVFTSWHTWLLCCNMTTVESNEVERAETMLRRGRIARGRDTVDFPFTLSPFWRNITVVLGPTPLHWFCMPGRAAQDDGRGLSYPVGEHAFHPFEQYNWPPRDPLKALEQEYARKREAAREQHDSRGIASPYQLRHQSLRQRRDVNGHLGGAVDHSVSARSSALARDEAQARGGFGVPSWDEERGPLIDAEDALTESNLSSEEESSAGSPDGAGWPAFEGSHAPREHHAVPLDHMGEHADGASESSSEGRRQGDDDWLEHPPEAAQSHVRRGSEGYEVRPKRFDLAYEFEQRLLDEQMMREHFDAQQQSFAPDGSPQRRVQPLLLPSEVLRQRAHKHDSEQY